MMGGGVRQGREELGLCGAVHMGFSICLPLQMGRWRGGPSIGLGSVERG